jgi:hypothetical protein
MTITLPPDLARRVEAGAKAIGAAPEQHALKLLGELYPKPKPTPEEVAAMIARLTALATDCGVSLTDEQLGREEMYD